MCIFAVQNKKNMSDKKQKGIALDAENKIYLEKIKSKGIPNTIRMVISKFKEQKLDIDFMHSFSNSLKSTTISLSLSDIDFIDKLRGENSFNFTLNCLIATASKVNLI